MLQALFKKIGISESIRSRVYFLWGSKFLYQVGFILAWTVIIALFVESFGIGNLLWLFLIDSVLVFLGSVLANFLFLRFRTNQFLIGTVLLTMGAIVVAWIFRDARWTFFAAAIIAKDFFFAQLRIAGLRKTESLFSPLQAQKVLPMVDSAYTIGTILSAVFLLLLLRIFPLQDILFFWAVPLVLLLLLWWYASYHLDRIPDFYDEDPVIKKPSRVYAKIFHQIKRSPFIKLMVLVVFFQAALGAVTEFKFVYDLDLDIPQSSIEMSQDKSLQASLFRDVSQKVVEVGREVGQNIQAIPSKVMARQTLAHGLSVLSLIFGIIALAVQLFLTSRILERFGIVRTMMVYFAGFFAMIGALIFGWTNMNFVRGYQEGTHSMFGSAYHISFYSMLLGQREFYDISLKG